MLLQIPEVHFVNTYVVYLKIVRYRCNVRLNFFVFFQGKKHVHEKGARQELIIQCRRVRYVKTIGGHKSVNR